MANGRHLAELTTETSFENELFSIQLTQQLPQPIEHFHWPNHQPNDWLIE